MWLALNGYTLLNLAHFEHITVECFNAERGHYGLQARQPDTTVSPYTLTSGSEEHCQLALRAIFCALQSGDRPAVNLRERMDFWRGEEEVNARRTPAHCPESATETPR